MKKWLKWLLPVALLGGVVPLVVACSKTQVAPEIDWSQYRGRFWAVLHPIQHSISFSSIDLSFVYQDYNAEEKFDKWGKPKVGTNYQIYTIINEDDWIKVEYFENNCKFIENDFKNSINNLHYKFDYFVDLTK